MSTLYDYESYPVVLVPVQENAPHLSGYPYFVDNDNQIAYVSDRQCPHAYLVDAIQQQHNPHFLDPVTLGATADVERGVVSPKYDPVEGVREIMTPFRNRVKSSTRLIEEIITVPSTSQYHGGGRAFALLKDGRFLVTQTSVGHDVIMD